MRIALCLLLVLNVLAAYSNHFYNDFQFDDTMAIPGNPAIRDLKTIPQYFVNPALFSSEPGQRTYRPVTTASLALDYSLGGARSTFFFHLSTFIWYTVLLSLMFLLFERIMNLVDRHPSNVWTALAATAVFGLHPASAETINYVIQRGDVYNALGCVAGLWLYIRYPSQHRFGWYLLPPVAAMLAKPPALVFPFLLLAYLWLFQPQTGQAGKNWWRVVRAALPALMVAGAAAWLLARMQLSTWISGASSPLLYRITQPWVALHYFKMFFLPTGLNIDPGWQYLAGPFCLQALAGYFFVLALLAVMAAASQTCLGKPVAFGIVWFLVALLPTSAMPLADVTNDHRMFFPFVGLTLSVLWSFRLALFRLTARLTIRPRLVYGAAAALAIVLVASGAATRSRNQVWSTPESVWRDAVAKNPRNPKAWSNYAAAVTRQGDYEAGLTYLQRAAALDPACRSCELSLAHVFLKLHRGDAAEVYLQRLVAYKLPTAGAYIEYANWLSSVGRFAEAGTLLRRAASLYPPSPELKQARLRFYAQRDASDRPLVFRALDEDRDAILSAAEMLAAPVVLRGLDQNDDGKLSAKECGAPSENETGMAPALLQRAHREFMNSQPILRALDANHDGEISAGEIRDAERELRSLDQDGDGTLQSQETMPEPVVAVARMILALVGRDRDESTAGRAGPKASERFRDLLAVADADGDGIVTLAELTNEVFYRADSNKDGTVTATELQDALRSGILGPIPDNAHLPHHAGVGSIHPSNHSGPVPMNLSGPRLQRE